MMMTMRQERWFSLVTFHAMWLLQGTLRDGCKVVVFNASFVSQQQHGSEHQQLQQGCVLQLSYNNVRRAHQSSKLGYVPPRALTRGISLSSVLPGGYISY